MLHNLLANPDFQSVATDAITLLGGILSVLLGRILFRLAAAVGVHLDDSEKKLVLELSKAGAGYAEEYAQAKLKGGEVVGGEEKRRVAIDAIRQLAGGRLKKWTDDQLATALESGLPELRAKLSAPVAASQSLVPPAALPPVSADLAHYVNPR